MSKSILSNERICFWTGRTDNLCRHHIYFGNPNRRLSEKWGCWCYLTGELHNQSNKGVHFDREFDLKLKKICQRAFEQEHSREEFMKIFGRSYL